MSPNTNSNISWDPSRLRLNQDRVARSQGIARHGRRVLPIQDKFIAGPLNVSWLCRASHAWRESFAGRARALAYQGASED